MITDIFEQEYQEGMCFLCGIELTDENKTMEHVIPRWVLRDYNLWDASINLTNFTSMPYRNMTIPCCARCNNEVLRPIEDRVSKAVREGFNSAKDLDKVTLFIWLGKIFYGLYYKEILLPFDRAEPTGKTMMPPEIVKDFEMHRILLHQATDQVVTDGFFPASIFLVKCKTTDTPEANWDLIDGPDGLFIAVRMGDVGMVAVLQDHGTFKQHWEELLNELKDKELHPLQFVELAAASRYQTSLLNRKPKFITISPEAGGTSKVVGVPIAGFSAKPIYDEWNHVDFARYFSVLSGIPFDVLCKPETQQFRSYLFDAEQKFFELETSEGESEVMMFERKLPLNSK